MTLAYSFVTKRGRPGVIHEDSNIEGTESLVQEALSGDVCQSRVRQL
jgi:hypothetical protein